MIDILRITGPIYLAIAVGYVVTWGGLFAPADMRLFGRFTINVALPALLFEALSKRSVTDILNGQYLLAYALASGLMLIGGLVWARRGEGRSLSYSSMFAMGMSCPNSGFVGYPVVLLMLGPVAGVCLALNMIVENLLLIPTLLAVADSESAPPGEWRRVVGRALGGLVRNPMILGIVSGFLCSLLGWHLPDALARTVGLFAQASAALSLFVIGGSLVGLHVGRLYRPVAGIAFGKLLMHPLVMLAVLQWIVPVDDPHLRTAVLLSTAMPMFGIYVILSQRHGHEATSAAALLVTTASSFFTLSGLLWLLRHFPL